MTGPTTDGSRRQMAYVQRLADKGFVRLTAVFVPKVLLPEIRELIKKRVAKWEREVAKAL